LPKWARSLLYGGFREGAAGAYDPEDESVFFPSMAMPDLTDPRTVPATLNRAFWSGGDHVAQYANRTLQPAEAMILLRYREQLSRRVLEIGCGAGRILGYLVALGGEVHGIDVSVAMVEYCRRSYSTAHISVADLGQVRASATGRFDAILAADNVIDVLDDAERRRILADLRAMLVPNGLLIFSSHNLGHGPGDHAGPAPHPRLARLGKVLDRNPSSAVRDVPRVLRRIRNRRRLAPLQYRASDHAVLNDSAHDYALLHYYIRRQDQERQLAETGFELLESLELDGTVVAAGEDGRSTSLYYLARSP
jgi:2-polyprenyl-3-methyl-5-hydroxy-6-metoxy-1,4-benzoquinol methylase